MAASVVVFGGSRGVGRLLTAHFLGRGWPVSAAARNPNALHTLRQEMQGTGDLLNTVLTDVADENLVVRALESHQTAFGETPSVVINTAAVQGPIGQSWTIASSEWSDTLRTNLLGSFIVTKCAVTLMSSRGSGSIIHFSGGGAAYGRPRFSAYAASKAGLLRLVETVSQELRLAGHPGITINAVAPGAVSTHMTDEILRSAARAGAKETADAEEVRRTGGTPPGLITSLVDFLCDPDLNKGLSGRLIHVREDYVSFASRRDGRFPEDAGMLRRVPLS